MGKKDKSKKKTEGAGDNTAAPSTSQGGAKTKGQGPSGDQKRQEIDKTQESGQQSAQKGPQQQKDAGAKQQQQQRPPPQQQQQQQRPPPQQQQQQGGQGGWQQQQGGRPQQQQQRPPPQQQQQQGPPPQQQQVGQGAWQQQPQQGGRPQQQRGGQGGKPQQQQGGKPQQQQGGWQQQQQQGGRPQQHQGGQGESSQQQQGGQSGRQQQQQQRPPPQQQQGGQGGWQQQPQQGGRPQQQRGDQGGRPQQQQQGGRSQQQQGGQGGWQHQQQQGGRPQHQQGGQGESSQQRQGGEGGWQQRPPPQHQQQQQRGTSQHQQQYSGQSQGSQQGYQQRSAPPQQQRGPQQEAGSIAPPPMKGNIQRGTLGRPGNVGVNYLTIDLSKMPKLAYHYDVKIMPERPKKFYRNAFEQFRKEHLNGLVAAFDGKASCYAVEKLPVVNQSKEVQVVDLHGRTLKYNVEIKETANSEIDLHSLKSYMNDKIYDKPMRALQCLEVVLSTPCHEKAIRGGRSFFKASDRSNCIPLGDGYELLIGLYQALVLGDYPFFNVDISHKSFPMPLPLINYLEDFGLQQRIDARTNLYNSSRFILPFLKGINIIYEPPQCFASSPRVYKVNGLSPNGADQQKFQVDNVTKTVAGYFKERGYNLKYPQLHCLHVGPREKNIYLPIELCRVEGNQVLNRKDGEKQVSAMIKYAATSTNERKRKIMTLVDFFQHNLHPTIDRFGIQIGNNFITVPTRLLNSPQLEYKDRNMASVRNGSWRMDRLHFLVAKPTQHKWAILYPADARMPYEKLTCMADVVLRNARSTSVSLEIKPEIIGFNDERQLDSKLGELKKNKFDLVFVVIPKRGASYSVIKQKAELQHGILTQCIKQQNVEYKMNDQLVGNVLLKVNSKLNGINHKIKDDPIVKLNNAMYMGADVTHPSPDQREIPSVVGSAASHDPYGASYNMQYRLQESKLEVIEDMETITTAHLTIYKQYQGKYPDHILYYRDGVSDGQFKHIKNIELRSIVAACTKLKCAPKLTCVIVVKRHHTRFFPNGEPNERFNKFNNVDPGTVVDRVIVHPNEVQFFMVSHQSIQGTAKPTRYNVIENTGNLNIDLLQQLTYNLCHLFPRCNRSVSYPAPAYLAHLSAARGRVYLGNDRIVRSLRDEYSKRKIVPEFLNKNPMYFV